MTEGTLPADPGVSGISWAAMVGRVHRREESRQLVIFSLFGVLLGIIGALTAWLLYHLINIFTGVAFYQTLTTRSPLYPPTTGSLGLWVIVIPVIGALLVGLMAKYGSDRIRGHGIPEAMEAVLRHKSRVSLRVAIFKPISAAIAVGTGGPFGAEGPVIQTGGALGSLLGQTMKLSAKERRILLACGGAAGMVGIFNTPIAAVALALELLLFEFRARSLVPVILASAVAAGLRSVLLGSGVMFSLGALPTIGGPLDLLWFVPLGIIIGACSVGISKALYVVEEYFDRLHIDVIFKPALGALVLGGIAFFQPRVLGMGYVVITDILNNHFDNTTLIGLALGKSVALIFSLGAGTSGGLLAPMLMIGAALGSGYGRGVQALFPHAGIAPGICGIVAMSSLFSAAARAPLTSFVFAFELTGDYKAVAPLMIGCMVADIVARTLSRESVMTERLARRGLRVDQGYEARVLTLVSVAEVMAAPVAMLVASTPLRTALDALAPTPSLPVSHPVVDERGYLVGCLTDEQIRERATHTEQLDLPIGAFVARATDDLMVAYPDEPLDATLTRLLASDGATLPVVERTPTGVPGKLIGTLSQRAVLSAWQLRDDEEAARERYLRIGWRRRSEATNASEDMDMEADTLLAETVDTLTVAGDEGAPPTDEDDGHTPQGERTHTPAERRG